MQRIATIFFLVFTNVFHSHAAPNESLEKFLALAEKARSSSQTLSLADLPIFDKLPSHLKMPSSLHKKLSSLKISDVRIKSKDDNAVTIFGTANISSQPLLVEITAFLTAAPPKPTLISRAQSFASSDIDPQKILGLIPSDHALVDEPVLPLEKLLPAHELRRVIGNVASERVKTLKDIQQQNQQKITFIKNALEKLNSLSFTSSSDSHGVSDDDKTALRELNYSVVILVPENGLSSITKDAAPFLSKSLDHMQVKEALFTYGTARYHHKELNIDVEKGLHLFGVVKINLVDAKPFMANLRLINRYVKLDNVDTLVIEGFITPNIVGSSFSTQLPGALTIGKKIHTKGLTLRAKIIEEKPNVSLSIIGGFSLDVPNQDPIEFVGSLDFLPPTQFTLTGELNGRWKNPLGLPSIEIRDVGLEVSTDLELIAASEGTIPIKSVGGRGIVNTNFFSMDTAFFLSIAGDDRMLVYGKFLGNVTLRDLVELSLKMFSELKAQTGNKFFNVEKLKKDVHDKVPNLAIKDAKVFISNAHQIIAHKEYHKGFSVKAKIDVWEDEIFFESKIGPKGVHALTYMPAFHIGPVKVSGPKFLSNVAVDYDLAAVAKINASSGPILFLNVDPEKRKTEFYIDGRIDSDILGGIEADTRIYFFDDGARFSLHEKIGNAFDADFTFSTKHHQKSRDLKLEGNFQKLGLDVLEHKMRAISPNLSARDFDDAEKAPRILERVFSHVHDLFDVKKVSFVADFDQMQENKLMLDMDFSVIGKEVKLHNVVLDFDNLKAALRHIVVKLVEKMYRHNL